MPGVNAILYKDGKQFCKLYDDAYGGPLDIKPIGVITPDKEGGYSISPELTRNRVALKDLYEKYPHAKGWDDSVEGIINDLIEEAIELKEFKKSEKKGIVMEESIMTWKAGTIHNMLKKYAHQKKTIIEMVQKGYDQCIADDEKVLNTVYLKSIGIKL